MANKKLCVVFGLGLLVACSKPKEDDQPAVGSGSVRPADVKAAPSSPTSPEEIAAAMTKTSKVYKIPWPRDAAPIEDFEGAVSTRIGTVSEITAFYRDWMAAHKWKFDAKNSTMDPSEGIAKSLGFSTGQTWCKRTSPITTVSIIVGSGDSTDRGRSAQIAILDLPDEDSCP